MLVRLVVTLAVASACCQLGVLLGTALMPRAPVGLLETFPWYWPDDVIVYMYRICSVVAIRRSLLASRSPFTPFPPWHVCKCVVVGSRGSLRQQTAVMATLFFFFFFFFFYFFFFLVCVCFNSCQLLTTIHSLVRALYLDAWFADLILSRLELSRDTIKELSNYFQVRLAAEETHAKALQKLRRNIVFANEVGTVKAAVEVLREELEAAYEHTQVYERV